MEDMGLQSMMSYGSYGGFLAGLLGILIKILFIMLIISALIGVLQWIKKNFFENVNFRQYIDKNPITKLIVGTVAAILILFLLIYFLSYLSGGGYGYTMGSMAGYGGFNFIGIIAFLLKSLIFIFVITLMISLIAYMMKLIGINNIIQSMNKTTQDTTTKGDNSFMNSNIPTEETDGGNL